MAINMNVNIELSSSLSKNKHSGNIEFLGETVADALIAFGLSLDEVGFVIHNNIKCNMNSLVAEGDTYMLYPSIIEG